MPEHLRSFYVHRPVQGKHAAEAARSQGRKEEVSRLAECAPRGEQREKEQDGGKG